MEGQVRLVVPRGISFVTPLGRSFSDITLNFDRDPLVPLRELEGKIQLSLLAHKIQKFVEANPGTTNDPLLGEPSNVLWDSRCLKIDARTLLYWHYFAVHELRKEMPQVLGESYCALSVCGTVFDPDQECFYMSVRPLGSQEDGGKIDAPGGVLNPKFKEANPFETIEHRFEKKLGFKDLHPVCIGVTRIFDKTYSLYNFVMYDEVPGQEPTVDPRAFAKITMKDVRRNLRAGMLTAAAKATLLLALSQEQFLSYGWGAEIVAKIMNHGR